MPIDIITQYILAIVPAFTAVVGMVTTIGVAIAKIKSAASAATTEVKEAHNENMKLRKEMLITQQENRELKQHLNKITAKMEHMYWVEDGTAEEE